MLLDGAGTVTVRYDASSEAAWTSATDTEPPFVAYPLQSIGVVRNGVGDGSSATLPPQSVTVGTVAVFTLTASGCVDCGARGTCNATSRECVCSAAFSGPGCTQCATGYFGPTCAACPTCENAGRCDDGLGGSGVCKCFPPYSGQNCSVLCHAAPYTCDGCNDQGGYCECGQCRCDDARGWSGANCTTWTDPCARLTLDGCPVCTASAAVECYFCRNSVCFANPAQGNIGLGNVTCDAFYTGAESMCAYATQPVIADSGVAVIIVILIFGGLGFTACFVLLLICACRRPRVNVLVSSAVTGSPDFHFPRRDREVIQMVLLPVEGRGGRPVQGIPLRQVPLKDLLAYQQERRKGSAHVVDGWSGELGTRAARREE